MDCSLNIAVVVLPLAKVNSYCMIWHRNIIQNTKKAKFADPFFPLLQKGLSLSEEKAPCEGTATNFIRSN